MLKKFLIISDSHGNLHGIKKILESSYAKETSGVLFLGDGASEFFLGTKDLSEEKKHRVRGNNDYNQDIPLELVIDLPDFSRKIFMTHGHKYMVYSGYTALAAAARKNGCDIALFGHSHRRTLEIVNGITIFNPGSISEPRDQKPPSFGILEISEKRVIFDHINADASL